MTGIRSVTIASDFTFSRHSHDEFGLGLITEGAHQSDSGHGRVEANCGDLITVSPSEIHDGAPVGRRNRSWTMLYFEPSIVAAACSDEVQFGTSDTDLEFIRPVVVDLAMRRRFINLLQLLHSEECPDQLELEEAISDTFVPIIRLRSQKDRLSSARVNTVIDRMKDDLALTPTLAELAEIAGVSRFQLIRAVERATGFTPFALLRQIRLDRARRLILAGHSIADAAVSAGFSDQSHLTRTFRSAYALTPGMFRASLANGVATTFKTAGCRQ